MGQYKTITNLISDWFIGDDRVNEVTKGDASEIDLSTITNFPLVHIIYNTNTYSDGYTTFNYSIQMLDTFYENIDDKLDVLDNMNELATQFVSACNQGTLFNNQIRITTGPVGTVIYDQLKNRLYGIGLNISLQVPTGLVDCG